MLENRDKFQGNYITKTTEIEAEPVVLEKQEYQQGTRCLLPELTLFLH